MIAGLLSVSILSIFTDFKLALIISTLLGFIFGLFSLGFTQRTLSSQTLEITTGNKHPERPMSWYEDRVREQINDMRFFADGTNEQGQEIFRPRALYRVFEPDIFLDVETYAITVTASRLMIRLISTYVEIEPVKIERLPQNPV
tara:strand:- start:6 stop:437 length:432 start_codon:yes stop_codon:yes gene_type:complete